MKKSKLLILGLIALMLVGGLALASCQKVCPNGGNCSDTNGNCELKGPGATCDYAVYHIYSCNCL